MINIKRLILILFWRMASFFGIGKKDINILCYHSISQDNYRFAVSASDFEHQIKAISKYAKFIEIGEAVDMVKKQKLKGPAVAVTFDDAYKDIINIQPIVEKYGILPAIFVFSRPDEVKRSEIGNDIPLLTFEEIKKLKSLGWTIGSHGATHADFSNLSDEEMEKEITDSKKELEEKLGFKIKYFSYPKGVYDKKIIEAMKKSGYEAAFTIDPVRVTKKTDSFAFPRTIIDKTHKLSEFPAVHAPTTLFIRKITDRFGIWNIFLAKKFNK